MWRNVPLDDVITDTLYPKELWGTETECEKVWEKHADKMPRSLNSKTIVKRESRSRKYNYLQWISWFKSCIEHSDENYLDY